MHFPKKNSELAICENRQAWHEANCDEKQVIFLLECEGFVSYVGSTGNLFMHNLHTCSYVDMQHIKSCYMLMCSSGNESFMSTWNTIMLTYNIIMAACWHK